MSADKNIISHSVFMCASVELRLVTSSVFRCLFAFLPRVGWPMKVSSLWLVGYFSHTCIHFCGKPVVNTVKRIKIQHTVDSLWRQRRQKLKRNPRYNTKSIAALLFIITQHLLPYWTQDAVLVNKTILVCRHLCAWADSVDWCCRWRSNDNHSRNTCRAWRYGACALSCQSNCKTINRCKTTKWWHERLETRGRDPSQDMVLKCARGSCKSLTIH